jgi:hypothetical protein
MMRLMQSYHTRALAPTQECKATGSSGWTHGTGSAKFATYTLPALDEEDAHVSAASPTQDSTGEQRPTDEVLLAELASLTPVEYGKRRVAVAVQLGIGLSL